MLVLPIAAALAASMGWAAGIVLAERPAKRLGAFEFTRIQLIACSAGLAVLTTAFGYWASVDWSYWPSFAVSITVGILLGNLAMIECLRRGGPRRTELLLSMKAPLVGLVAFVWLGEVPLVTDVLGAAIVLVGVSIAILYGGNRRSRSDAVSGSPAVVVVLGLSAATFQGIGFLIMKPAMLEGLEPLAASAIRLLGAAFLISLLALWPTERFKPQAEVTPILLGRTVLPGFIGYVLSSSLLLYAFANYDAGIVAVLGSLSPVLVLPILWVKEGIRPRPMAVGGAALAVVGTTVIAVL